jgi:hypothetical protein
MTVYYFAPRESVFDTIRVRNAARERIAVAIELARRNLPPTIAGLAADELGFHLIDTWAGMPKGLQLLIEELEAMDAAKTALLLKGE